MTEVPTLPAEGAPELSPELIAIGEPGMQEWLPVHLPADEAAATPDQSGLQPALQPSNALPDHVTHRVIGGSSALGASVFIERGAGLLANVIAARLGGTQTFGAYSLAISTANNISTYAAGGMGATAARFSGKYPRGSAGYPTLNRVLSIVAGTSAIVAAIGLWFGAAPIAHVLGKESLTTLLRWAGISAAGVVLLECARGLFVGQRRLAALFTLSLTVGLGMVVLLPLAAHAHRPIEMITLQGGTSVFAVLLCVLLGRRLGLTEPDDPSGRGRSLPLFPMLREVWSFGLIQLSGLVSSNLAGWWLTTLVARSDLSLVQMSFFTVGSQLRNIVSLAPGLLTEGSYAVMADPLHEQSQTPQRVMALCCFAALSASLLLGGLGILIIPALLQLLYGRAYLGAGLTVAVALATAVTHMGTSPAAARLSIVSIRSTAVINTLWAVFVGVTSTVFLFHGGSAWQAMAIYFFAHILSSAATFLALRRWDHLPAGMIPLFGFCTASIGAMALLSLERNLRPALSGQCSLLMLACFGVSILGLFFLGRRHDWLPTRSATERLLSGLRGTLTRRFRRV